MDKNDKLHLTFLSLFVGPRILIAGGIYIKHRARPPTSSAYIMEVHFYLNCNMISEVCYKNVPNMPFPNEVSFYNVCEGRSIVGCGLDMNRTKQNGVQEFDGQEFKPIPQLKKARCGPRSCYINKTLYVSGGIINEMLDEHGYPYLTPIVDSIEMLYITASDNGPEWELCKTNLPYDVRGHTLTRFKDKMILIGGYYYISADVVSGGNKVWEGTLQSRNEILWEPMPSMQKKRSNHFSIAVDDNIYVFGGEDDRVNSLVEVFDGREWKQGPEFSFSLNAWYSGYANVVVDKKKRIIITTNKHGIVIYDPIKGTIKPNVTFKLREYREHYAALLQ